MRTNFARGFEPEARHRGLVAPVNPSIRLVQQWLLRLCAVALAVFLAQSARADEVTRSETLRAIHRIENPRNSPRPGRHGELGAYQFRRSTWRMHTRLPFERALDRSASDEVAIRHYEWLRRGLERNGLAETPYNIALAWNGGLDATVRGSASQAAHDYAERVNNLVQEHVAVKLAAAP